MAQPVSQQSTINDSDSHVLPESQPLPEPLPQSECASEVGKSKAPLMMLCSPATDCNSDSGQGASMHAHQLQPPAALQQDCSASAKATSTLVMDIEYFMPVHPPAVGDHIHLSPTGLQVGTDCACDDIPLAPGTCSVVIGLDKQGFMLMMPEDLELVPVHATVHYYNLASIVVLHNLISNYSQQSKQFGPDSCADFRVLGGRTGRTQFK